MKKIIVTTAGMVLSFLASNASAALRADVVSDQNAGVKGEVWAVQFSSGLVDGEAKEYVFIYDEEFGGGRYKLSELDWDIKRVVMVGGNLTLRDGRGTINAGYWKALTEGDGGHIEDYDWLDPTTSHWTEYSDSSADVDDATLVDINGGWEFVQDFYGLTARVLVGYKMDDWKWSANGGYALYSDFDYVPYYFEDETICKYKQELSMPYLGGSADWKLGGFVLAAYCTFSPFVEGNTTDNHLLRSLKITDHFKDGDMLAAGASAKYAWKSGWFFTVALDYQVIDLAIGDAGYHQKYEKYDLLYYEQFENYAGMENEYLSLSLGVGKSF